MIISIFGAPHVVHAIYLGMSASVSPPDQNGVDYEESVSCENPASPRFTGNYADATRGE